jgi:hypothetical protein
VQGLSGERLAADGDDAAGGDLGSFAGDAVGAAVEGEEGVARIPRHQIACDIHAGVLPTHPAVRDTVLVEGKDQWMVASL